MNEEEIKQARFDYWVECSRMMDEATVRAFSKMSPEDIKRFNDMSNGVDK